MKDTLKEIVKGLKQDLKKHSKNLKDEVVKIKMTEALKSINEFCGLNDKSNVVKDEYVIQTMRYLELLKAKGVKYPATSPVVVISSMDSSSKSSIVSFFTNSLNNFLVFISTFLQLF